MFSKVNTAVCIGIEGKRVSVETDLSNGLPSINIVGLASTMVMEAKERIKMAIINSDYEYPRGRITVNLTPANLRKNGSYLDLPIAIGVLVSNMYVSASKVSDFGIIGELSLDGEVLGVDCVMPLVFALANSGIKKIIVPKNNYAEAKLISEIEIIPIGSLNECVDVVNGEREIGDLVSKYCLDERNGINRNIEKEILDFKDIKGQENAKRAITIAVAGMHGLLMIGSPGCGKSMMARRIPTIMPKMNREELIETAIIYSVVGKNNQDGEIMTTRPFRSPHNTIGRGGLLGGGMHPVPGEISLAHNGVLFLDEVCEFERKNIESLRLPIEEKSITHFRQGLSYKFPCNFQLVMAANPCKCGYYGDPDRICKCTQMQLDQYRRKLSGPMMDRIDLRIRMDKVKYEDISEKGEDGKSSEEMRKDVMRGIAFAKKMGRNEPNGKLSDSEIEMHCVLGDAEKKLMENAYKTLKLSPRSYKRILKVARTIADMAESESIKECHLAEALSYRMFNEINDGE